MLVRKFISHRLGAYYSQPHQSVVGGLNEPLHLDWGRLYWQYKYKKVYHQNQGQWLTPVELFQPFYSNVLVRWILDRHEEGSPLNIVEFGAGRGTNAKIILKTLQKKHPKVFDQTQYTIIDSSASLISLQRAALSEFDESSVSFHQKDLMSMAQGSDAFLAPSKDPTIVIALEVWDNLPHDKIRVENGVVEQAEIRRVDNGEPLDEENLNDPSIEVEEVFATLTDPLLRDVLGMAPGYAHRQGISWVPSVACSLLCQLQQARPHSSVLVADFDWLPHGDFNVADERRSVPARRGEPIVTCMEGIDHPCYTKAPILSDILFPTDFRLLSGFCQRLWGVTADVKYDKQRDFVKTHGPSEVKATTNWLSGYSPMIEDFDNCSVMTISSRTNAKAT
jgi:hypothetical protein